MAGLLGNIIIDMIRANRQQEMMRQNQEYESQKNARELFETKILGPAIEEGDLDTLQQFEKTTKQYYPKDTMDLIRRRAEFNQQNKKLERMRSTIQAITGAVAPPAAGPQVPTAPGAAYNPVGEILSGQPSSRPDLPSLFGTKPDGSLPSSQEIVAYTEQASADTKAALQQGRSVEEIRDMRAARPVAQPRPPATAPVYKAPTLHIDEKGKVSATLAPVSPETAQEDATSLAVMNRIQQGLKSGQPVNLQDILMEEQNRTGTVIKPAQVENIAKGLYGASFEAAMQELERMNRSGKLKMTDAQMFAAASQHAARATGMRGIPQVAQQAIQPEVPRLTESTAEHLAAQGGTPRTAQPEQIQSAIDARSLQTAKQQYANESAQLQARLANAALPEGIQQKVEPLLSAQRQTDRIFDIFSRKPNLVGKGFTDTKDAIQKAQIQLEGAPKDETWGYQNGALLNSIASFLGKADPEAVELYKAIADLSDTILRARSGAQINEQEYRRLTNLLFSKWDEPATFKAGLDRIRAELRGSIENKVGLAVTPGAQILQGIQGGGGQSPYAPQPSPYAPAVPRGAPARPLPMQPMPAPQAGPTTPQGEPEVRLTQPEVAKISRALRDAFKPGTKIYEADLAAFLVRRGFATKGREAQAKAKLLQEIWKGAK